MRPSTRLSRSQPSAKVYRIARTPTPGVERHWHDNGHRYAGGQRGHLRVHRRRGGQSVSLISVPRFKKRQPMPRPSLSVIDFSCMVVVTGRLSPTTRDANHDFQFEVCKRAYSVATCALPFAPTRQSSLNRGSASTNPPRMTQLEEMGNQTSSPSTIAAFFLSSDCVTNRSPLA